MGLIYDTIEFRLWISVNYICFLCIFTKMVLLCILMLLINKNKLNSDSKKFPGKMTGVKLHLLFQGHLWSVSSHSLHWNPVSVLLSQVFELAALIANYLIPNSPCDNRSYYFFYQQAVIDRIRSFNNGTFSCVSVVVSIMFDNYQTFANFVEISYAY